MSYRSSGFRNLKSGCRASPEKQPCIQHFVRLSFNARYRQSCLFVLALTLASPLHSQSHTESTCGVSQAEHQTWGETKILGHGLREAPRNLIRPRNLIWELPIAAATGVLIAEVDRPAVNRIQSLDMQRLAGRWANVGLGLEIGSSALSYGLGCGEHRADLRDAGFTALAAMGTAGALDFALKVAFDRQYPYSRNSTGTFWGGGRSFPSGHAATSFAWASATAHKSHNKWVKLGAYALATGVSLSRYPAKKHFPSDILIGATIGYVTGTYLANHSE
jgi:membrane-associated phospholipid phosphatase